MYLCPDPDYGLANLISNRIAILCILYPILEVEINIIIDPIKDNTELCEIR